MNQNVINSNANAGQPEAVTMFGFDGTASIFVYGYAVPSEYTGSNAQVHVFTRIGGTTYLATRLHVTINQALLSMADPRHRFWHVATVSGFFI